METPLDELWDAHREQVRWMLISLTRDIDLADDILQETYLRARSGFASYRGGDAKAWLAAIARNAFYAHARRKYFGSEVALDSEAPAEDHLPGTGKHVVQMALRQAIADLPEALRQALLMKHYGGFTYSEIAQRLGCAQGTAQQRVFTAIRRLRETLGAAREELAEMTCGDLSGKKLVDYVYGKLSTDDTAAVKEHLTSCRKCGSEADETVELFRMLDSVECSYKIVLFTEPGDCYVRMTAPQEEWQHPFQIGPYWRVLYAAMEGEEVVAEELPSEDDPNRHRYALHLPRRPEPGEIIELMFVCKQDGCDRPDQEILTSQGDHKIPVDAVWLIALRFDEHATVIRRTLSRRSCERTATPRSSIAVSFARMSNSSGR